MKNIPILKNLQVVLKSATDRYNHEFQLQEIRLNDSFKTAFRQYVLKKGGDVEYFNSTSIVTNKVGQYVFIANQWFAIASYYVDFVTELLTYQEFFDKICQSHGIKGDQKKEYAVKLKTNPTNVDKQIFISTCLDILKEEYPGHADINMVAGYLWNFASNYSWWSGSKTVDRRDFYISPVLSLLNVVNANAEYLAEIVLYYASDLTLRRFAENIENFTIDVKLKDYYPNRIEQEELSFQEDEQQYISNVDSKPHGISISAASLERFKSKK